MTVTNAQSLRTLRRPAILRACGLGLAIALSTAAVHAAEPAAAAGSAQEAKARRALDQQVAVGQQGDEQALDQRGLADDGRRQALAQGHEGLVQAAVGGFGHGIVHGPILTHPRRAGFTAHERGAKKDGATRAPSAGVSRAARLRRAFPRA